MIPWGWIIPSLLVGGFVGWLVGVIMGHGETQARIERGEKRIIELLTHLHQADMDRLQEMDLLIGAITDPAKRDFYQRAWADLRIKIDAFESHDHYGFEAIKNRP